MCRHRRISDDVVFDVVLFVSVALTKIMNKQGQSSECCLSILPVVLLLGLNLDVNIVKSN